MSSLRALEDAALVAALRAMWAPGAPPVDEAGLRAELRGRVVAVPVAGGVVTVDLGDWTSLLIVRLGGWEPHLARLARLLIGPGSVAVDAGAHVGVWTLLLASLVGPGGRVVAFEPDPVNAARARAAAGGATVVEAALGDGEGEAVLRARGDGMLGSLAAEGEGRRVRVTSLDAAGLDRVDFLKIDTEGWELAVLRGARATIARSPEVVALVELHEEELAAAGLERADVIGELEGQGLVAMDVVPAGDRLLVRPLAPGAAPAAHHLLARRDGTPFEVGLV